MESNENKDVANPAKFHYVFNMRDLSRVFQGVLLAPKDTILGGGTGKAGQDPSETLAFGIMNACVFFAIN